MFGASGDEIAAASSGNDLTKLQAQREALRQSIVSTESQRNSLVQRTTAATQFQNQVNALESRKSQCTGTSKQRANCLRNLNNQIKYIRISRNFKLAQTEARTAQTQITQLDSGLAELRNREAVAQQNIVRIQAENQARAAEEARQAAAAEAARQAALEEKETNKGEQLQDENEQRQREGILTQFTDDSKCTDTDGGYTLDLKGTAQDETQSLTDECVGSPDDVLLEASCTGGHVRPYYASCLYGCTDGACNAINNEIIRRIPDECKCYANIHVKAAISRVFSESDIHETRDFYNIHLPDSDYVGLQKTIIESNQNFKNVGFRAKDFSGGHINFRTSSNRGLWGGEMSNEEFYEIYEGSGFRYVHYQPKDSLCFGDQEQCQLDCAGLDESLFVLGDGIREEYSKHIKVKGEEHMLTFHPFDDHFEEVLRPDDVIVDIDSICE